MQASLTIVPARPRTRSTRTDLPPEAAERVKRAMRLLRDSRYNGINAGLAEALGMSGAAVGAILSQNPRSNPSYGTAEKVAKLIGISVPQLLSEDAEIGVAAPPDRYPERARALARLQGLLPPEVVETMRSMIVHDRPYRESEWIEMSMMRLREYEHTTALRAAMEQAPRRGRT